MEKVIICGLGALGLTYACKLRDKCDLTILADKERIDKYIANPPIFNGIKQYFRYITPSERFDADLIIISTKFSGLNSAILNIKNFVTADTRIISLVNGISSENMIAQAYPQAKVLRSYFIGHSAVREGNSVKQDGFGEIVVEYDSFLKVFFEKSGVNYKIPDDIEYSMWLKFALNIFSNQTSAILGLTFGDMKRNKSFMDFAKKIINEVQLIAGKKGIKNLENFESDSLNALSKICDEGKTSMYQDILSKRKTEVEIFAGEIIRLGKEFGIPTPYNQVLYNLIKIKEEQNEHSIHTC